MGVFKKLIVIVIVAVVTFYVIPASLADVSKTFTMSSKELKSPTVGTLNYSIDQSSGRNLLPSSHSVNVSEDALGVNLQSGVYNLSQLNGSLKNDILNPSKWYVGNTSLSPEYAFKVYKDTLKVVKNATETSNSIIDRFLGLFGGDSGNSSVLGDAMNSVEKFLEGAKKLIEKTEGEASSDKS